MAPRWRTLLIIAIVIIVFIIIYPFLPKPG